MYPPHVCPCCLRGDLYIVYEGMIKYRLKYHSDIEKDDRFQSKSETINFPLGDYFDALALRQCCRVELMIKDDNTHEIYGSLGVDHTESPHLLG